MCYGGTFDHLHSGHKLFITQAALVAKKKMLIGVTGDELLVKKKFAEQLEDYETRAKEVELFLRRLAGNDIELDIFVLRDAAGKSATDTEIQACVLTKEVEKGGQFIN